MILVVTWTALIWQARRISELQHENRMLRGEIQAGDQEANSKVANAHAALDEEITRLRAEAREVHKLRNEVSQLRAGRSESEKLRAENQRLKTAPISDGQSAVQSVQQPEFFAKENWIFAGYATPEAALQSFLWAMRQADMKTLQASLTEEGWARFGKGRDNVPAAALEEEVKRKVKGTAGFRILERIDISEDEIVLRIHSAGEGSSAGDQNIAMRRLEGEWKVERSYRDAAAPPVLPP
jgi:hypothetical protein